MIDERFLGTSSHFLTAPDFGEERLARSELHSCARTRPTAATYPVTVQIYSFTPCIDADGPLEASGARCHGFDVTSEPLECFEWTRHPAAFLQNSAVRTVLAKEGVAALPLVIVGGRIVSKGPVNSVRLGALLAQLRRGLNP